ncbi:efflux RND transporter permease subunit [Spongiibacter taiwanensis]|uniref:efflux RND transporter permease subunit n=1 Tax=Spongiibacter taiwanensis TaxID=1748242 RepID=UPI002035A3E1|nr:efflux RND transporter permease subunit [Spongiibacter taiwanensis]USA42335.1 efflux RND transporter permease subunit [Spongiibacter taiwanensis]
MLESSVRRGTLLAVIVLIVCVLGIAAAFRIPVQMIPDLSVRTITVITGWAGATPQDVESEILIEQERYLRTLPNLQRMESLAETGRATVELEFPFGVDVNEALIRVSNALSQVPNYPENVDQPLLISSSFSENAFMYFNILPKPGNPLGLDIDMIGDFVEDDVRPRMERVTGVSQIEVRGSTERQVKVLIDPAKLAQRGLTLVEVRDAIRNRNRDVSGGDINDGKRRYLLRMIGRFRDLSSLENMIVARRSGSDILLSDIAQISMDHFEVRDVAFVDGRRAINLAVRREAGSNVIQIKHDMLETVAEMRRDLLDPNGLDMVLLGDDVRYVQDSVRNVVTNLSLGALLATLILYVFLRSARATLIGLMGIPVCTIAAFLGLMLFDRTINVISLAGIAFAIGMTLDNTIVVLESIEKARRRGLDRIEGAIAGVKEVWPAVLASSMTTVLVFAPVLFVQEEAGQIYSDIAIAISSAIIASMLLAVLVVPAACARLGRASSTLGDEQDDNPLLRSVAWLTDAPVRRRGCIAVTLILTLGAAWWLLPPAEYLPEGEEPKAFTSMIAPPGYNLEEMQNIADDVQQHLLAAVDADPNAYHQGDAVLPSLKYYLMRVSASGLRVISEPTDTDDIHDMMRALTDLFSQYPGMRAFSGRGSIISSSQGGTRAVNLDIAGPELEGLYRTAAHAFSRAEDLFANPQLDSRPASLSLDQPLVEVQPRWHRMSETGFNSQDFGYAVSALSDGAFVDEFFVDDDKVDIFLYSAAGRDQKLDALALQPVLTPNGQILPLNALADITQTVDSDTLRRVNGRRTVTLLIIPPRDVALETAVAKVRNEMLPAMQAAGEVDPEVSMTISGAADQLDATQASLSQNFIVAVLLIYLLLVAIFTHWGYPLIILATVPLGIAGGIVGLVTINGFGSVLGGFHQPFDMITMLGFVILLGTVVNNPILIVDHARVGLARGKDTATAVREAVAARLRPILMSTFTTIFGLAPLVFIPGSGTELYRGVGIVVLTGILISTAITLTFLPCLLVSVLQWRDRKHAEPQC